MEHKLNRPASPADAGTSPAARPCSLSGRIFRRRLREAEAMRVVDDAGALAAALVALFEDEAARARMARNAAQLLEDGRGALERTLALIAPMLPAGGNRPD